MLHSVQSNPVVRPQLELRLLARSLWDFAWSLRRLHAPWPCITIFGSARLGEHDPAYQLARDLGQALGRAGFAVMTGGGPGLMEAANRGVREAGGQSLGCRMAFSFEQPSNQYMDRSATVRYFFVRKVVMCRQATGFAVLPGGIGTLDELFEILALIQTKRMRPKPIVLIGTAYWRPLMSLLDEMVVAGTVAPKDVALITVTDDITDAVRFLVEPSRSARLEPLDRARSSPEVSMSKAPVVRLRNTSEGVLEPLADIYRELGLSPPSGRIVAPLALPHESRRLLVHEHGMTQTLERAYGQNLAVRVLRSSRQGMVVTRQILLLLQQSGVAVEMALIRIYLESLPLPARQLILDEAAPLGTILRLHGVRHEYDPSIYFAVKADDTLREHAALNGTELLYGRRVKMSGVDGQLVADAIEISIPGHPFHGAAADDGDSLTA
jgi:uncharacterized protein (TIGR00730 family)